MTITIHHGSCIDILPKLETESVNLVVTDPPYICHYRDRENRRVANDNHADWLYPSFAEIARVLRPDSFCISFYGWSQIEKFMTAWKLCGLKPVGHLVWPKHYASKTGYLAAHHEQAFLLAKGFLPKPDKPLSDIQTWRYTGNKLHPKQKAVEIITPLIEAFSKPGDTVLDPFMGSGTTGEAAAKAGRHFIGIELDPAHYETARRRLALDKAA